MDKKQIENPQFRLPLPSISYQIDNQNNKNLNQGKNCQKQLWEQKKTFPLSFLGQTDMSQINWGKKKLVTYV